MQIRNIISKGILKYDNRNKYLINILQNFVNFLGSNKFGWPMALKNHLESTKVI